LGLTGSLFQWNGVNCEGGVLKLLILFGLDGAPRFHWPKPSFSLAQVWDWNGFDIDGIEFTLAEVPGARLVLKDEERAKN
jgi:hypothetical protein